MSGKPYPRPPSSRKPKKLSREESAACMAWKMVPVGCDPHHILYEQVLRNHGQGDKVWDLRNRLVISRRRHERHHSGFNPIRWAELPQEALDFAEEIGMKWWIDHVYPAGEVTEGERYERKPLASRRSFPSVTSSDDRPAA